MQTYAVAVYYKLVLELFLLQMCTDSQLLCYQSHKLLKPVILFTYFFIAAYKRQNNDIIFLSLKVIDCSHPHPSQKLLFHNILDGKQLPCVIHM